MISIFAHSENILLTGLTESDTEVRRRVVETNTVSR